MYYIGGRYYDPDIKRYISAVNPEEMQSRAGTVLRLCFIANLYELLFCNTIRRNKTRSAVFSRQGAFCLFSYRDSGVLKTLKDCGRWCPPRFQTGYKFYCRPFYRKFSQAAFQMPCGRFLPDFDGYAWQWEDPPIRIRRI